MNARPKDIDDTARLISGLLDGSLQGIERARLEVQLETDPAARRLYLQMIDQEIELQFMAVPAEDAVVVSMTAALEQQLAKRATRRRWASGRAAAAAAAIVAVMLWPHGAGTVKPDVPVVAGSAAGAWHMDFEDGNVRGWSGKLVTDGTPPPGNKDAMAAAPEVKSYGTIWMIEPPADWDAGLTVLTARSTLHFIYRHTGSALEDIFLHTLPPAQDAAFGQNSMFRLTRSQFPGPAGRWQTASIPFASFARKMPDPATGEMKFTGGPPADGEVIAALSFSAPHAVDFMIDRIWITADGTGTETIEPLP